MKLTGGRGCIEISVEVVKIELGVKSVGCLGDLLNFNLGGGFKYFICSPWFGQMSQFD